MKEVLREETSKYDFVIIGGGSSGMACAIMLSDLVKEKSPTPISIAIFEQNKRLGKKLLLTGNGRCNLTNRTLSPNRYHGHNKGFSDFAIESFDNKATLRFFSSIGLTTIDDESGKTFPFSMHSSSVLDSMRFAIEDRLITVFAETKIVSLEKRADGFRLVDSTRRCYRSDHVVIACGGAASPFTGSDGNGYDLLRKAGHRIISPIPGIVQIKTETEFVKAVSGVKVYAKVHFFHDGSEIRSEEGELLFTDYGISGPPVLQLSGDVSRILSREGNISDRTLPEVRIDFFPGQSAEQVLNQLKVRRNAFPNRRIEQFLVGLVHNRLAVRLTKETIHKPLSLPVSTISDEELTGFSQNMKQKRIIVTGTMPLQNAQITIGGADTNEFDPNTMQSRICPGLYACGEVLDVDGDCGGYNLQWAWSSAFLVAKDIAKRVSKNESSEREEKRK